MKNLSASSILPLVTLLACTEPREGRALDAGSASSHSARDGAALDGAPEPRGGATADAETAAVDNPFQVTSYGRLYDIMHHQDTAARVALSALDSTNLFAVGALSGLRGEVTIANGMPWISLGGDAGIRLVRELGDEQATLLVSANVASFRSRSIDEDIPYAELDRTLERLLREAGFDVEVRIPLRIEGAVRDLSYHVLNGAESGAASHAHHGHAMNAHRGVIKSGRVSLVGFYSKHDQGVFTHMGSATHFHVIDAQSEIAGHVDSMVIARGSELYLPTRAAGVP